MILHIDHIATASLDFEQDIKYLEGLGYKVRFIEKLIYNPAIKRDLMREFTQFHDIALLDKDLCISIELLNYNRVENIHSLLFFNQNNPLEAFIKNTYAMHKENLNNLVNTDLNKLFLYVADIDRALIFWKMLGFNLYEEADGIAVLLFKSLLTGSHYFVHLINKSFSSEYACYLDNRGFNSLAFISSSIKLEREKFTKNGFWVTDIESLKLNGRKLSIFFVKGPAGELVEIIEI